MLSTDGSMVMILWSVKYRQKTVRTFSGNKKPTMELQEQKHRIEADTIMEAYLKSGKNFDEIMTFLSP